jgi:hypothetical protein
MEKIGMGRVLNYQSLFFKPPVESGWDNLQIPPCYQKGASIGKAWPPFDNLYQRRLVKLTYKTSEISTRRAGGLRWPPKGGLKYKISFIIVYLCK